MKNILPLIPLVALAAMSCSQDQLTSLPESSAQPLAASVAAGSNYQAFDVGTLGSAFSQPMALSKQGVVFGFSPDANNAQHAFRWEDGVLSDQGLLPRGEHQAVSDGGLFGGALFACPPGSACDEFGAFYLMRNGAIISEIPIPPPGHFVRMHSLHDDGTFLANIDDNPYVYRNGVLEPIGTLGGGFTQATARNDKGQIIGTSRAPGYRLYRAFVWENGVTTALPDLESTPCSDDPQQICTFTFANAINKDGDVVGSAGNAETGEQRGVLWRRGQPPIDLGALPGQYSSGWLINDHGQVVVGGLSTFFLWDNGTLQPIGNLGGSGSTTIADLNERGELVGASSHPDGFHHAFVWRDGQIIDLGTGSGIASGAGRINDRGEISGTFFTSGFQGSRAILWRPVNGNEPVTTGP